MRVDEWVGSRSIHSVVELATLLGKDYITIVDPPVFNVSLKMAFGRSRGCRGERIVRSVFD